MKPKCYLWETTNLCGEPKKKIMICHTSLKGKDWVIQNNLLLYISSIYYPLNWLYQCRWFRIQYCKWQTQPTSWANERMEEQLPWFGISNKTTKLLSHWGQQTEKKNCSTLHACIWQKRSASSPDWQRPQCKYILFIDCALVMMHMNTCPCFSTETSGFAAARCHHWVCQRYDSVGQILEKEMGFLCGK